MEVAFLYATIEGERRPMGTAFLGRWPVPDHPERPLGFLLTAHHVIDKIRTHSDDRNALLRLNTLAGNADWLSHSVEEWDHPDPNVDCSIAHWHPHPPDRLAHRAWNFEPHLVATDDMIRGEGVGIGDEVFMVGLFRNHLGRDRNEPIIRVGNIAAIPADPIRSRYGEMRAILVEARSIGGLSGSPVFVHMGHTRWVDDRVKFSAAAKPFLFLGLMQGHWESAASEIDFLSGDDATERIHTGIGVVVPAQQIMGAISPRLEERAMKRKRELDKEDEPKLDAATEEAGSEFEGLTGKLVEVPKGS